MPSTFPTPPAHDGHRRHAATSAGHRIAAPTSVVAPGAPAPFRFRVLDPTGAVVARFEERHERPLHLIVVSGDLGSYAHLHPQLGDDGTWSVELPALRPGGYRIVADAVPAHGPDLALTHDLVVPGPGDGRPLPAPAGAAVVDDLVVDLDVVPTVDGITAALVVSRDGTLVEPDPYLGARGHLVAIRADDLAYLHVHPDGGDGQVSFTISQPTPGRYRLFFDFSVDGRVRTAAFTVDVAPDSAATSGHGHGGGGHRHR